MQVCHGKTKVLRCGKHGMNNAQDDRIPRCKPDVRRPIKGIDEDHRHGLSM